MKYRAIFEIKQGHGINFDPNHYYYELRVDTISAEAFMDACQIAINMAKDLADAYAGNAYGKKPTVRILPLAKLEYAVQISKNKWLIE